MENIGHILELSRLAIDSAGKYPKRRFVFDEVERDKGPHLLGITGLRGTGKSIILKQLAAEREGAVYISLDTLDDTDLFELVKKLNRDYKFDTFLLDEVHFIRDIDAALKKIYDFLDVKIIFTSSVSLGMFHSAYDLSRRLKLIEIYPFSFREYLFFRHDRKLPALTFQNMLDGDYESAHLEYGGEFEEYLKGGNLPFHMEEPDVFPLLRNILDTIIEKDIPRVAKIPLDELDAIAKTVRFIGKSEVDGINHSSISRNLGITKYKARAYVELLGKCFVLHSVMPTGTNVLKEPKILLAPPFRLLFKDYDDCLGALREDFLAEMLAMAGMDFHYLKSARGAKTPDFLVDDGDSEIVVEVGGKGKGREQFKGIDRKKQLILTHSDQFDGIKRPLHLAGFIA